MRQGRTHKLDRPEEIRGELMGDLLVAEFLGGTEKAISGIADDDVDAAKFSEGLVHDLADFRQIGHVEMREPQLIAVFTLEVSHRVHLANGDDGSLPVDFSRQQSVSEHW